jgi:hypothetical protein
LAKRGATSLSLFLEWDNNHLGMSVAQGMLVASTLDKILSGILACPPNAPLSSLDCLSQANLDKVCEWNGSQNIQPVERCIHDVIADQVLERPDAEAVCAWDGSLTYRELDLASGRLATQLARLGVKPEALVPLCFEKSVCCCSPFFLFVLFRPANLVLPFLEMDTSCNARRAENRWRFRAFGSVSSR